MKKLYSTFLLALLSFTSFAQSYSITTALPINIISGSGTQINGLNDDNFIGPLNIGFSFPFFNTTETQFYLAANGSITFGVGDGNVVGTIPSVTGPNNCIAFASTDQLPAESANAIINYFVSGNAPNRILVINYQNIRHYQAQNLITSVQIQLYESSGKIEIHNIQNSSGDYPRTIGIENSDGQIGFSPIGMNNSTSISLTNEMIRFVPCILPIITSTNIPTLCPSNSSTTLSATCPQGTLIWSNGASTSSITVSPTQTTTYTVTCTNENCETINSVTVEVLETPTVSPNGTFYFCSGNDVTLSATSNLEEVSFQWKKENINISDSNSPNLNVSTSGNYSVSVSKDGCTLTSSGVNVIENTTIPNPPIISPSEGYTCPNTSIQLNISNCSGNILWSNGQTGSSIAYLPTQENASITATCTINGCTSNVSNTYTNTFAKVLISTENNTICPSENTIITSTQTVVISGVTYQWFRDNNLILGATNSTLNVTIQGSYYLKVTYPNNCSIESSPINITIKAIIQPIIYACGSNPNTPMNKLWDKIIDGYSGAIYLNEDKSFYLGGFQYTNQFDGNQALISEFDSTGNVIFSKHFGGENNETVKTILKADNNHLMLGITNIYQGYIKSVSSYQIAKVASNGDLIFTKTFAGLSNFAQNPNNNINDYSTMIKVQNGYIIGGSSEANSNADKSENSKGVRDFWIIKIDENGNKIWDKTIGGDLYETLQTIVEVNDGYILGGTSGSAISGDRTSTHYGHNDFWLVKIDTNGNILWDKSYGGTGSDVLSTLIKTTDGGLILAGSSNSGISGNKTVDSRGENDFWIIKTDINGNKIWEKRFGGSFEDNLLTVNLLSDGSLLLAGNTQSPNNGDRTHVLKGTGGYADYWLVKTNSNGNKIWDKNYGSSATDIFSALAPLNDYEVLLLGSTMSSEINDYDKSSPNLGNWLLKVKACEELLPPTTINQNQAIRLVAAGCSSTIVWNTGSTNTEIAVSPTSTTTYTATCNNSDCTIISSIQVNVNPCGQIVNLTQANNILTGTSQAPTTIKAQNYINATNKVGQPPTNASAKYASGKAINLNPGFKVELGSIFQAKISITPCNE